jgi:hypothetical protein
MPPSCRRTIAVSLIALGILGLPVFAQHQDDHVPADQEARHRGIDLRPKFEKGQQIRYRMEVKNTSSTVQPGTSPRRARGQPTPDAESTVEFGLRLDVREVARDGVATVDMELESMKFRLDGPDMSLEFDSTRPSGSGDDMAAAILNSIAGTTMRLTIDRAGNITQITGGEGLAALGRIGAAAGGGSPLQLFDNIMSIKHATGFAEVGQSWENQDMIDSGLLGRLRMDTRHTLTRMQGRDAIVDIRGRTAQDSEGARTGHVTIRDAAYTGRYVWDTGAGSLKQMDASMSVRAETNIGEESAETRSETTVKITKVR